MLTCVVRGCKSNSVKHSHLHFFCIPKDSFVKDEWMDVLSLKNRQITDSTRICELHFRDKDFCATNVPGRKVLKHHALPVINIGKSSVRMDNSDEEFMQCGSDSDPEIVEVKKISKQMSSIKQEPKSPMPKIKQEPVDHDMEPETGRRPSRRAAQLAVKKIQNTVRSFALTSESGMDVSEARVTSTRESVSKPSPKPVQQRTRRPAAAPKPIAPVQKPIVIAPKPAAPTPVPTPRKKFRDQKTWHAIRAPLADVGLLMECHEELLSAAQAEALMKAQTEYNNVMKMLRTLKASNVRIICETSDRIEPITTPQLSPTATATLIKAPKGPGTFTVKPANLVQTTSSGVTVVPVHLVTVQPPVNLASSLNSLKT